MPEPRCLYRLQLLPHVDFGQARALVPYLRDLRVSHLYLSPVLQARRGSTHGYDVTDPTRVSEELGGEAGLRALCADARAAGLGVVLDVAARASGTEVFAWENFRIALTVQYVVVGFGVGMLLHARRRTRRMLHSEEGIRVGPLWVALVARLRKRHVQ